MSHLLTPVDISNCITALIARNKLWAEKDVYIYLICNQTAGCFKDRKKSQKFKKVFNTAEQEISSLPTYVKSIETKVFSTEYAGHARDLAMAITSELVALKNPDAEYIIATAGGDGTCLEVQTSLFTAAQEVPQKAKIIMKQITMLRLPLGTGNDGTDGHSVEETIALLRGPLVFDSVCALKITPEGNPTPAQIAATGKDPEKYCDTEYKAPWYCFNMAGIGIDAFIAYMTNVLKKKIPGNFYNKIISLCGIVYDKAFPPGTGLFEFFDKEGNKIKEIKTQIELYDMGPTGNRTLGGGIQMLPDENNCCLTYKMSLLSLILNNNKYSDGSHLGTKLATFVSAHKVRITYDKPVLLQWDGEVFLLCKEHFPLVMEKTEPCLRVLRKAK